ncbi:MAG: response regulator transcription factor [Verrucomicrobiota bacterium]|jgi:DNA-binding NarL/FixJ family response regulator
MIQRGKSARPKKILIVDDHPMMREGLAQLIANQPGLQVCGEAGDAREALEKIPVLQPDLVLTDITMPGKNGLELIKDIQALHPGVLVLVISMHDEALYVERVLRSGGRGYVMKQEGGKMIAEAIRRVLDGQIHVSEKMSAKILEIFSGHRADVASSPVEKLTDREFEVFELIGQGLDTKEMAEKLHLSTKTIEVHRANVKAKLKLTSMAELIRYAVRWAESQNTGAQ